MNTQIFYTKFLKANINKHFCATIKIAAVIASSRLFRHNLFKKGKNKVINFDFCTIIFMTCSH